MTRTFKAKGYELTRKSENKAFTHAVIFRNDSSGRVSEPGATFHVSLKLAQAATNKMAKRYWIQVVEIVEVEEITKAVA